VTVDRGESAQVDLRKCRSGGKGKGKGTPKPKP
jgi:hypothetical protein